MEVKDIILIGEFLGYEVIQYKGKPTFDGNKYGRTIGELQKIHCGLDLMFTGRFAEDVARDYRFEADWKLLMTLVEKIEGSWINNTHYDFHILPDAIIVCDEKDEENPLIFINRSEAKGSIEIEAFFYENKKAALFQSVILLLKWLTENKS